MSYKARHAATPKYVTYARATGASIAAMAVLSAVPAVAVEASAPAGDVGETTPIAEPAGDAVTSPDETQDEPENDTDSETTEPFVPLVNLPKLGMPPTELGPGMFDAFDPSTPLVRDTSLVQGETVSINTTEFNQMAALAEFTFDNPHALQGVHVAVDGPVITVSADNDATPGAYTITGSAKLGPIEKQAVLNLTVTPAPSTGEPGTSETGTENPDGTGDDAATPTPKRINLDLTIGDGFVSPDGLVPTAGSALKIASTVPHGIQTGDVGGVPTFEATDEVSPGTYVVTVTQTMADGTAIDHEIVLTVKAKETAPEPPADTGTQAEAAQLAWVQNTAVAQNSTATAKFTGNTGETKPTFFYVGLVHSESGEQVPREMVTVDNATGNVTFAPSWDMAPGQYTAYITAHFADESVTKPAPLTFTVTAGKSSDRYNPTIAPAYIGTDPDRVVKSKVNFGNTPAPFGVTYTVNDKHNVVDVEADGTVIFHPNPTLKPGDYFADVTVSYAVPEGAAPDTDTIRVRYSVGESFMSLAYNLVTDKTTVARRETATIGIPHDTNGRELPSVLHLDKGRDWPAWVTLNSDGTLTAAPDLDVKPGTYVFTSLATFPDKSTGEIVNTIEVPASYKTKGFKYKRKDGLGAKVGRAIDQALGTEKPGTARQSGQPGQPSKPGQPGQQGTDAAGNTTGDTETAAPTTATPTDNMVPAPASVAADGTKNAGTRGATSLQTTGADDTGLLGAGAAAGGFALAAAAAFAMRRREQSDMC